MVRHWTAAQATARRFAFAVIILLAAWTPSAAHETKAVGGLRLTVGWGEEPAFSGFRNFVEVDVVDGAGHPVVDLGGGALSAEVSFGDEHIPLSLVPARGQPGKFRAWLVPTRPGTYSFHVTGTIKGQAIDMTSTCSDTTFACVADVSAIQFPVKDPSAGQLADRLTRELPRAQGALETAASARTVAFAGLAGAVVALGAAIGFGMRKGSAGR